MGPLSSVSPQLNSVLNSQSKVEQNSTAFRDSESLRDRLQSTRSFATEIAKSSDSETRNLKEDLRRFDLVQAKQNDFESQPAPTGTRRGSMLDVSV
jgi:hypothetical protein